MWNWLDADVIGSALTSLRPQPPRASYRPPLRPSAADGRRVHRRASHRGSGGGRLAGAQSPRQWRRQLLPPQLSHRLTENLAASPSAVAGGPRGRSRRPASDGTRARRGGKAAVRLGQGHLRQRNSSSTMCLCNAGVGTVAREGVGHVPPEGGDLTAQQEEE